MLSAFDYDVPGVSHGHQTTVFDQNRLLRMGTIFEDFVATADHKRAVGTVLESCSCCREMNTVNDAFNSGTTAKGFTIMLHAANFKSVFYTKICEWILWSWNSTFSLLQTHLLTSLCQSVTTKKVQQVIIYHWVKCGGWGERVYPQVYTNYEGTEEVRYNPQVDTTNEGIKKIKNNPQVYTTQEGIGEIKK